MSDQTVTTWRVRSAIKGTRRGTIRRARAGRAQPSLMPDERDRFTMPLICEDDFERVRERAQEILRALATSSDAQIAEAHQILEARVNNDAE
jgi:hypothetical protein